MATNRRKQVMWASIVMVALLVGAASVFAFSLGKYEKVKATGGVVSIPLPKVADGKAHYYRFEDGGKEIDFVVIKASDGRYRTAFDACDSCFAAKKGYEQKGDVLVCKNCNQKFAINRIGPHAVGGCNPSYLPSQTNASNIIITTSDLKAGARYF
ncbi:DUF2318 domain-containing protein [Pelobacter propionicus]|uniref:Membrane iron-sulfur containing protein FtrD-like domain-containing protein n=1 Tax=Pelobacter propionicus (strain DSM 2379 / NBRC 103807 / OttBd1) TaxID=338966 RepID=A0R7M4_PELPD|nr:DUF2318 domain-containing protein [Pelobacter propionicus]ABL01234.1 conserved hypothetical protein [Pelobacter propionicus DSM 2379]